MPHKRREDRLAYMDRYHERTRPAPQAIAQRDPILPPLGELLVDADGSRVQCHECGRWYGGLQSHVRVHGLTADSYKERYELPRTLSLWSPQYQERQRQAAIARGQGDVGRTQLEEIGPHPRKAGTPSRLGSRVHNSRAKRGVRKPPPAA